jgi:hypothetical protein
MRYQNSSKGAFWETEMKNIWFARVQVEDVVRMLLRRTTLPPRGKIAKLGRRGYCSPQQGEVLMLWDMEPDDFSPPAVLIAERSDVDALLPKLLAIPGAVSSVTAFSRLWSSEDASAFFTREPEPVVSHSAAGLVGLVLCELLLRLGTTADLRRVGMGAVTRTFSFACASLVVKGGGAEEIQSILRAWIEASEITANEFDGSMLDAVAQLCRFIEFLFGPYSSFDGTSSDLARLIDDKVRAESIDLTYVPLTGRIDEIKKSTRETRFSLVEQTINELLDSVRGGSIDTALACGFLLTQLDVGSMDFFEYACSLAKREVGVPFAYLMCSGLLSGPDFLWKADGLGIEIAKMLRKKNLARLEARPDLSLAELKLLRSRIAEDGFRFRTKHPTEVEVELIADVTGTFANGIRRTAAGHRANMNENSSEQIDRMQQGLRRLVELAATMRHELSDMSEGIGGVKEKLRKGGRG